MPLPDSPGLNQSVDPVVEPKKDLEALFHMNSPVGSPVPPMDFGQIVVLTEKLHDVEDVLQAVEVAESLMVSAKQVTDDSSMANACCSFRKDHSSISVPVEKQNALNEVFETSGAVIEMIGVCSTSNSRSSMPELPEPHNIPNDDLL